MWPDGTAVVVWPLQAAGRPPGEDYALLWRARPPGGPWVGGDAEQVGGWFKDIDRAALVLREDGSGEVLWAVNEAGQPSDQDASLQVASWLPGGPAWIWQPSGALHSGYASIHIEPASVAMGPDGHPVAAMWRVREEPGMCYRYFYSQKAGGHPVYLPVVIRNR
jgi:hypothetical protein